jgi:hypothetical protein
MTTRHADQPDDDRPPTDPLRPDRLACPCGATADRDGLCRKCRARALWSRRAAGRRTHTDQPRRIARPTSIRPGTRRPGR